MMVPQRDDSHACSNARVDGRQVGAARGRLNEAVTELRRLTQEQLFQALERLADVDDIPGASSISVESVRRLRLWSAEHLRLAAELEAAARCCRLIEQELNRQIDALLAGTRRKVVSPGDRRAVESARKSHRVMGMRGWLKMFFPIGHSIHEQPERESANTPKATPHRLRIMSMPELLPISGGPEADVTALILGPLEVSVAGRHVVRWSNQKARGVLQYLLIHHGRPVRRDVLMDLQWRNHTYTAARNNLNVALYSLRNTMEELCQGIQPILYRDGCYLLNPELKWWIDRDEFLSALSQADLVCNSGDPREAICHYQKAIQLYRGPLFEDDLTGDWYLLEQRHLNQVYLQTLEKLGEIYFHLGEFASAEQFGQLALSSDPCCESVHRLLMRCYASQQEQQLVSRQYRICVNALRDELDVSPGAETIRLFHDLTSVSP